MAKKPFLKLRRLYEDEGLLQKELSELSGIPLDTLKGRLNAPEDKGRWKACEIVKICKVLHIPQEQIPPSQTSGAASGPPFKVPSGVQQRKPGR